MFKKALFISSFLFSSMAFAQQQPCGPTEVIVQVLTEKYKEVLVMAAQSDTNPDHIISVWVNNREKTMTVLKSSISKGVSCGVEAGNQLEYKSNV